MNNTDLPPLPSTGVISPEVCDAVSLYLAVSHDLTEEQKQRVSAHLKVCPQCVHEYRLVKRSAQLVSSLEGSEPSARVDVAVMAAIAARAGTNSVLSILQHLCARYRTIIEIVRRNRRRRVPIGGLVAAAADTRRCARWRIALCDHAGWKCISFSGPCRCLEWCHLSYADRRFQ